MVIMNRYNKKQQPLLLLRLINFNNHPSVHCTHTLIWVAENVAIICHQCLARSAPSCVRIGHNCHYDLRVTQCQWVCVISWLPNRKCIAIIIDCLVHQWWDYIFFSFLFLSILLLCLQSLLSVCPIITCYHQIQYYCHQCRHYYVNHNMQCAMHCCVNGGGQKRGKERVNTVTIIRTWATFFHLSATCTYISLHLPVPLCIPVHTQVYIVDKMLERQQDRVNTIARSRRCEQIAPMFHR